MSLFADSGREGHCVCLQMEQRVAELAHESKKNEELAELRRQIGEQEKQHQQRLSQAKDALTKALQAHDKTQSQLFDYASKAETVQAAKDSEELIVSVEVERNHALVASLRREIVRLVSLCHLQAQFVVVDCRLNCSSRISLLQAAASSRRRLEPPTCSTKSLSCARRSRRARRSSARTRSSRASCAARTRQ